MECSSEDQGLGELIQDHFTQETPLTVVSLEVTFNDPVFLVLANVIILTFRGN